MGPPEEEIARWTDRVRRARIEKPHIFQAICDTCDQIRGDSASDATGKRDFGAIIKEVIESMSAADIREWLAVARKRGDANMLGKFMELVEKSQSAEAAGDVVINLVPYEIPDSGLDNIILKCDLERFTQIDELVNRRKTTLRNRPGARKAARLRRLQQEAKEKVLREEEGAVAVAEDPSVVDNDAEDDEDDYEDG